MDYQNLFNDNKIFINKSLRLCSLARFLNLTDYYYRNHLFPENRQESAHLFTAVRKEG